MMAPMVQPGNQQQVMVGSPVMYMNPNAPLTPLAPQANIGNVQVQGM